MQREIILKADKIGKFCFNPEKFQALTDISFTVGKGEFLTLTGSSGSGKSALLYILSALDTAYHGELIIQGETVTEKNGDELEWIRTEKIGFIDYFQFMINESSCLRNVMNPALKLGRYCRKQIEETAFERLRLLGLQDKALQASSRLSGGEQRRLAIARALINDPAIVIGRDPTANLDFQNSDMVLNVFQKIVRESTKTVIATAQDKRFAEQSDRSIELIDGRIISI